MNVQVRPMELAEVDVLIDYFHQATPEHLELLGVDPTRLPDREAWRRRYEQDFAQAIEARRSFLVLWQLDGATLGFSTVDKIRFGEEAYMHLHVVQAAARAAGYGSAAVRQSVDLYFEVLRLKRLFCQPNAFNVAPNRALQRAGFKYLRTYNTVPGPLNYHQAVTQWVIARG